MGSWWLKKEPCETATVSCRRAGRWDVGQRKIDRQEKRNRKWEMGRRRADMRTEVRRYNCTGGLMYEVGLSPTLSIVVKY